MPKGTRVERCVKKVKKSGKGVNPYAVCQASTKQSYATGKKLKENIMKFYLTEAGIKLLVEFDPRHTDTEMSQGAKGKRPRLGEPYRTIGIRRTGSNIWNTERGRIKQQNNIQNRDITFAKTKPKSGLEARRNIKINKSERKRTLPKDGPNTKTQQASAEAGAMKSVSRALARLGRPTDQSHLDSEPFTDLRSARVHGGKGGTYDKHLGLAGPKGKLPK
jgi:hypothetical protein